jgi:hypothetical protein
MNMDAFNQMAQQTKAASGGGCLPPGDYPAVLGMPIQKDWDGKRFWEIPFTVLEQHQRKGNITIWDFDADDRSKAVNDPQFAERCEKTIGRHKRLMVDVGVWSRDLAQSATWDTGDHSVVGALAQLNGRKCHVVVVKRKDDPTKTNTFINAPRGDLDAMAAPSVGTPPPGSNFTGTNIPSLDDIPF